MKINFTKKEYNLLLDMLYVSDWMMHAFDIEHKDNEYRTLQKRLQSYHKEMGADDRIEYSEELGDYFETGVYDAEMHDKFIEPYEEKFFWEELMDRLSVRDVINEIGFDAYEALEAFDRMEKVEKAKEKYVDEFEEHGLDNLRF